MLKHGNFPDSILFKYLPLEIIKTLYYSLINPFYYTELKFGMAHMLT